MANILPTKKTGPRSEERRKKHGRSRISNGYDILPDIDGRSVIARRYKDIARAILADQGGAGQCSESRQQLIRRFSAAAVMAEQLEAGLARGEPINIQEHATLSSTLVRLAARIGINMLPKDVTELSLDAYTDSYMARVSPAEAADASDNGCGTHDRENSTSGRPKGKRRRKARRPAGGDDADLGAP